MFVCFNYQQTKWLIQVSIYTKEIIKVKVLKYFYSALSIFFVSHNHDLLFYGTALNLSIKFPCNLTKTTFCLPLGRPHRAHICIYGHGSWALRFSRLTARSGFKTAPGWDWSLPSVWQKLCQHQGLTTTATTGVAAEVTQIPLEKGGLPRAPSRSSNRDSPAPQTKPEVTNLCCKTTTFTAKGVFDWRSGDPELSSESSLFAECSITIKQS